MTVFEGLNKMWNQAVNAIDDAEAQMKGEKWMKSVKNEDGTWKDLEGWKDAFEPKAKVEEPAEEKPTQELTEEQKAAQKKAMQTAVDYAFDYINESVTLDVMNAMMEVSSTCLGSCQDYVKTQKDQQPDSLISVVPMLDAIRAVLLTYRFDKTGKGTTNKFKFIRKQACMELTELVYNLYDDGKTPEMIAQELEQAFGPNQQVATRIYLTQKVDEVMDQAGKAMMEKNDKGEGEDESLKQMKSFVGTGEKNVVAQFIAFVAVQKLEVVDEYMKEEVKKFLKSLHDDMKNADGSKKSKEEVKENMFVYINKEYGEAQAGVAKEVKSYTDMAKAILLSGPGVEKAEEDSTAKA